MGVTPEKHAHLMGAELAVVKVSQSPLHVLVAGELHHSRAIVVDVSVDHVTSLPEVILARREKQSKKNHRWHGNPRPAATFHN